MTTTTSLTTTTTTTAAAAANNDAAISSSSSSSTNNLIFFGGCSNLQKRLIQKSIPNDKTIIDATKCPDSSAWLNNYLQQEATTTTTTAAEAQEPFIFLNFGCNKGYDALSIAETISRNNQVFNKQKWIEAIGLDHYDPGNCYQGGGKNSNSNSDNNNDFDSPPKQQQQQQQHRPVEIYCVEAMPQTADLLMKATEITKSKENGFYVYNYAMAGPDATSTILFPNPTGLAGREVYGLTACTLRKRYHPEVQGQCKEVVTKTIDDFVTEHVDDNNQNNNNNNNDEEQSTTTTSSDKRKRKKRRRIPYMSIDVEGFDYTVLMGAKETLKRIDYLEFEYHNIGDWKHQNLKDLIIMLEQIESEEEGDGGGDGGFVCYWSGVNQLWKLSVTTNPSCWMEYFEFHQWSNIACVSPKHQPKLATKMEQVFEDTIVNGTAITTR